MKYPETIADIEPTFARALSCFSHLQTLGFSTAEIFISVDTDARSAAAGTHSDALFVTLRKDIDEPILFAFSCGAVHDAETARMILSRVHELWNAAPWEKRDALVASAPIDRVGLVAALSIKGLTPWVKR